MIPYSGPVGYSSLIVRQAWSTCYEMYFYFLLTLLLFFKCSKKLLLPLILFLFVLGYSLKRIYAIDGFYSFLCSLMGVYHVLFFCEGIVISFFHERITNIKIRKKLLIMLLSIVTFIYCYILCHKYSFSLSIVICPLLFVIVYKTDEILPEKSIFNYFMIIMGDISFSIYLIHSVVIRFLLNQCHIDTFVGLFICTLMVTIALSLLCYNFIEKKFINFGKRLSFKLLV